MMVVAVICRFVSFCTVNVTSVIYTDTSAVSKARMSRVSDQTYMPHTDPCMFISDNGATTAVD